MSAHMPAEPKGHGESGHGLNIHDLVKNEGINILPGLNLHLPSAGIGVVIFLFALALCCGGGTAISKICKVWIKDRENRRRDRLELQERRGLGPLPPVAPPPPYSAVVMSPPPIPQQNPSWPYQSQFQFPGDNARRGGLPPPPPAPIQGHANGPRGRDHAGRPHEAPVLPPQGCVQQLGVKHGLGVGGGGRDVELGNGTCGNAAGGRYPPLSTLECDRNEASSKAANH